MVNLMFFLFPLLTFSQSLVKEDIFDAVREGNLRSLTHQIEVNPQLADSINHHNHSLLILAAYYGHESIITYLLPRITNLNYKSDNGTALAAAVVRNHRGIIEILLNNNADVNITDYSGVSPLMYAIVFRNIPVIKLLINNGANLKHIDNSGKTTFEYAISSGDQEIINLLKNQN